MIYIVVVLAACIVAGIHAYLALRDAKRGANEALLRELRERDIQRGRKG